VGASRDPREIRVDGGDPELWWTAPIDGGGYAAIAVSAAFVVQAVIALVGLMTSTARRTAAPAGERGHP
jgi:hypothetical protein